MRDFVIVTDSCCDLSPSVIKELDVHVVPMGLTVEDTLYKHYYDYRELSQEEFYEKINCGIIGKTSGVNSEDAMMVMRKALKQNKDILYLSFSSAMSVSYQSAIIAADELKDEFPNSNIVVIDTCSACVGQGLLVYLAVQKKLSGLSLEETAQFVEENKLNIYHSFMVDNLMYLQKSGRVSHLTAITGTMLNIKPVFTINNDGKIANDGKVRGKVAGRKNFVNKISENCTNSDVFLIGHADAEDEALELKSKVLELYPNANVIVNCIGPIIGNCLGPGALAITFYSENR